MKQLTFAFLLMGLFLGACAKEEPRPPKQAVITQGEEVKTGAILLAEGKEKLAEAKSKLAEEGKYGCCLKEPCNMCALDEGDCDCYKDLKKGNHVCVECYAGWQQGKGADDKIKKEDVKTGFMKHEHDDEESKK